MLRDKILCAFCLASIPACGTPTPFALAPGAEQVRITNVADDVAGCTPVGNLKVQGDNIWMQGSRMDQMKNQTIGFGGNAAFITEGALNYPEAGIAYRCPKVGT